MEANIPKGVCCAVFIVGLIDGISRVVAGNHKSGIIEIIITGTICIMGLTFFNIVDPPNNKKK